MQRSRRVLPWLVLVWLFGAGPLGAEPRPAQFKRGTAPQLRGFGARRVLLPRPEPPRPKTDLARLDATRRAEVRQQGLREAALDPAFVARHTRDYAVEIPLERLRRAVPDQGHKLGDRSWIYSAFAVLGSQVAARTGRAPDPLSANFVTYELLKSRTQAILAVGSTAEGRLNLAAAKARLEKGGGGLDTVVAIVKQHGLVPESAMPQTRDGVTIAGPGRLGVLHQQLAQLLSGAFREYERINLRVKGDGEAEKEARAEQKKAVRLAYAEKLERLLGTSLGRPPATFRVAGVEHTPRSYADQVLGLTGAALEQVTLISSPDLPYDRRFDWLTSTFYNVAPDTLARLMRRTVDQGQAVYVTTNLQRGLPHRAAEGRGTTPAARGILSLEAFNYDALVPLPRFTAADRKAAELSLPEDAVAVTGYDPDRATGGVRKWKALGSWGESVGDRGVFHLYPDFLAHYAGTVTVPRTAVPEELFAAWQVRPEAAPEPVPRPAEAYTADQRAGIALRVLGGDTTAVKAAKRTGLAPEVVTGWVDAARRALRGALRKAPAPELEEVAR